MTPVRDASGRVASLVGVQYDVTELVQRRQAERELQQVRGVVVLRCLAVVLVGRAGSAISHLVQWRQAAASRTRDAVGSRPPFPRRAMARARSALGARPWPRAFSSTLHVSTHKPPTPAQAKAESPTEARGL